MNESCVFCGIGSGTAPSYTLYQDKDVVAFLDISPASAMHTLVIPRGHYETILNIPTGLYLRLMSVVKSLAEVYSQELGIEAFNIINANGKDAQQSIPHFHVHLIPRAPGDGIHFSHTPREDLRDELLQMQKTAVRAIGKHKSSFRES